MIRKRDDPTKKLSVIKRHPDDSPYLVNQQQHFQTGVSVDQNPLHQRVSGGLWCIVSCPFIRKRNGKHGSFEAFFLGKRTRRRRKIVPLMECGTLWRSTFCLFCLFFFVLSLLVSFALRYCPIWEKEEQETFPCRLFCMCVCAIVVYPRAAEHRRAV